MNLPSPVKNGWTKDDEHNLIPLWMNQEPAPQSIIELVACHCKKGCKTRCGCRVANLTCTEACGCHFDECTNVSHNEEDDSEDEDDNTL